jgi:hypothetical protein
MMSPNTRRLARTTFLVQLNQNFCGLQSATCSATTPRSESTRLQTPLQPPLQTALQAVHQLAPLKPVHLGRNSTGNAYINSSMMFQLVTSSNSQVRAQLAGLEITKESGHTQIFAHVDFNFKYQSPWPAPRRGTERCEASGGPSGHPATSNSPVESNLWGTRRLICQFQVKLRFQELEFSSFESSW